MLEFSGWYGEKGKGDGARLTWAWKTSTVHPFPPPPPRAATAAAPPQKQPTASSDSKKKQVALGLRSATVAAYASATPTTASRGARVPTGTPLMSSFISSPARPMRKAAVTAETPPASRRPPRKETQPRGGEPHVVPAATEPRGSSSSLV